MKYNIYIIGILTLLLCAPVTSAEILEHCNLLPYQRAEAELPVHAGYASLPNSYPTTTIVHVVKYDTALEHKIPRDSADPRLHSHIWIVDQEKCKKLAELPLPKHASINVHGVETDIQALPVNQLANGDFEFKYAFSVPEKPKVVIVRKVIVDKKWQVITKQDYVIHVKGDARKIVNLADWSPNGQIIDLSEPIKNTNNFIHYTVLFANNSVVWFRYPLGHPESQMTNEGLLFDDSRSEHANRYYPRFALITSFAPNMQYFRQFTIDMPKPDSSFPGYIFPLKQNKSTLFQLGNKIFNSQGVVIFKPHNSLTVNMPKVKTMIDRYQRGKRQGELLPDYNGSDRLQPEAIKTYLWRDGAWTPDPSIRPQRLFATDIINNGYDWPEIQPR